MKEVKEEGVCGGSNVEVREGTKNMDGETGSNKKTSQSQRQINIDDMMKR